MPGTRRALIAEIRHHVGISIIENDSIGEVLTRSPRAEQAGPVRHNHLTFRENPTD